MMKKILKKLCFGTMLAAGISAAVYGQSTQAHAETLEVNEENFPDEDLRDVLSSYSGQTVDIVDDETGEVIGEKRIIDTDTVTSLYFSKLDKIPDLSKLTKLSRISISSFKGSSMDFSGSNVEIVNVYNSTSAESLKISGDSITDIDLSLKNTKKLTLNTKNLKSYHISSRNKLNTVSGLNKSKNLETVYYSNVPFTSLDFSSFKKLTEFSAYDCKKLKTVKVPTAISSLSVVRCPKFDVKKTGISKLKNIESLSLSNCNIPALDIRNCKKLLSLYLNDNKLKTIDTSQNKKLKFLQLNGNKKLKAVNVSKNKALESLYVGATAVSSVDTKKNKNLSSLECYETKIHSLNIAKNKKLTYLNTSDTAVSKLNIRKNTKLSDLNISRTGIRKLNTAKNKDLSRLDVSETKISTLNLKKVKQLNRISFYGSKIKKLPLSRFTDTTIFYYAKKGSTISLKNFLGTGYTAGSDDILQYNSKNGTIKVKKKGWGSVKLTKGKKTYYISVSTSK